MKITATSLMLCTAILAGVVSSYPFERKTASGKEQNGRYASWDDVNVIAHGLLQLGHGLKEHVDKTKGQMRDITTKLKSFNGTVTELGKQTQRLQEDGEALKAKARALEERENQVLNISTELWEKAEQLQQDRQKVQERIGKLEEKVDGMLQGEGPETINKSDAHIIQWMLEAQNRRIDDLVERIRVQQEKLEKQNVRIRTLQNQIKQRKDRSSLRRKVDEAALNGSIEQGDSPIDMAVDCHELFLQGESTSGVYTIQPINSQPFEVYCQMTSEGGWTVIQRRQDGSLDFDQLWQAYQNGFGKLEGEFWLGLEKIHTLSQQGDYILHVEFSDWKGESQTIKYPFHLSGEENSYSLHLQGGSSGDLESALTSDPSGVPFSTRDRDNDQKTDMNCAKHLSGGWWFSNCGHSNLNGKYFNSPPPKQRHQRKQGVFWKTWRGRYYPLKTTVMKIAPAEIDYK
ncbi:angiopoietin-related protein 4-like [Anguilla anguilla]|uniref:angiopoietin-related protein 4-like n=1 Tax=Anguilla anguilla TaxID=7936 RepID=UPI0015B0CE7B|nr:angiopoietin-related protein 4-like [Anguilla anguilla]